MDDVAEVAYDLTESDRMVIDCLDGKWRALPNNGRFPSLAFHLRAPSLCEMRIKDAYPQAREFRLLPAGLAVREHLRREG